MAASNRPDPGTVDLNLLYTFRAVCDAGSVSAAAKRLGRTQPAISSRLRLLERDLGVRLLERAGRGVALSPAGRAIAAEIGSVVEAINRVIDHAHSALSEPIGTLRIGALPTVSAYLLAPCIERLLTAHPDARFEISAGFTSTQLEQLKAGELDIVLGVGPLPKGSLEVIELGSVYPVLAVCRARLSKFATVVSLRDLARLSLVGYGQTGDLFFDEVWRFLQRNQLESKIRLLVPHIQTLKELVSGGACVAILPEYTLVDSRIASRRVEQLNFSQPVWAALRSSSRDVALVRKLLDQLSDIVPRLLERPRGRKK